MSFTPLFFNHFSLGLNREKCSNESRENKTKQTHASAADSLPIRIDNLDWSASEATHHPACMDIFPTINQTCYPYLPSR